MHISDSGELVLEAAPNSGIALTSSSCGTHPIHFLMVTVAISPSAISAAFVAERTAHWPVILVCDIPLDPTCPKMASSR